MDSIATRVLVLSDTHGEALQRPVTTSADVAIHCGDITEESKLDEFRAAISMLEAIDAPIKLVIAGNHDFTLDDKAFSNTRREISSTIDEPALKRTYGDLGEARALFDTEEVRAAGILFLGEGIHRIALANGALMTVYASPYTPSKSSGWGYQYDPSQGEHAWAIDSTVDLAMTHSPPRGLFDLTESKTRAGSPGLFAAIAKAKPKVHCFGLGCKVDPVATGALRGAVPLHRYRQWQVGANREPCHAQRRQIRRRRHPPGQSREASRVRGARLLPGQRSDFGQGTDAVHQRSN